jgi:hypothetical protein
MLVAIMKIFIFLCVLVIPLRGPSRRRETRYNLPEKVKVFSKYGVNEHGGLEIMDEEGGFKQE